MFSIVAVGIAVVGWCIALKPSRAIAFGLSLLLCIGLASLPQRAWSQDAPVGMEGPAPTETPVEVAPAANPTNLETQPASPAGAPVPAEAVPAAGTAESTPSQPLPATPVAPGVLQLDSTTRSGESVEEARSNALVIREPVQLNDRPVMLVSAAGGLTARGRANAIRDRLARVIEEAGVTGEEPQLEIREDNELPILVINGEQLLTVTATDVTENQSAAGVAEEWRDRLRQQLKIAIEEQQPDFLRQRGITALRFLCSALVLDFLFRFLWVQLRQWMLRQLTLSGETNPSVPPLSDKSRSLVQFGFRAVATVALTAWWLGVLSYTADLFPATRRFSLTLRGLVVDTLSAPLIPLGEGYSVLQLLMLATVLMVLVIVAGALTDLLKSNFLSVLGIGRGVQEAIAIVFRYSFITLSAVVLLQLWGIDLSSLTILASALGVGIGFGFQDIAKNFGSGLVLVFERPIQVGDFVEVGGYAGTIEKLGARSTTIRTLDNLDVFVPNSRFLEEEVTNWSHARSPSRIRIPVGVAYGSDLELVQEGLLEAAQSSKNVLKTPEPIVLFQGFGDSALDFLLLVCIARPQQHGRIRSELNFKIDAAFRRRNIEIPFPQQDLHVRSGLSLEMLSQADAKGAASRTDDGTEIMVQGEDEAMDGAI